MNHALSRSSLRIVAAAFVLTAMAVASLAQTSKQARTPKVDLAFTFAADRTNAVHNANQWIAGGGATLGVDAWHGLGIAASVTGLTTSSIGSQGLPLNFVIATFGPRYRRSRLRANGSGLSFYGEGLLGEANGFKSTFASTNSVTDSSSVLAVQVGGGADYYFGSRLGIRLVDAHWIRTQFANGTTNEQNHLQLGAGVVIRF